MEMFLQGNIKGLATFGSRGQGVITGCSDGTVHVWSLVGGRAAAAMSAAVASAT